MTAQSRTTLTRYSLDWQMQEECADPAGEWVKYEDVQRCIADAATKWIPVSERLPDDKRRVIVFDANESDTDIDIAYWDDEAARWYWEPRLLMSIPPTHWMPLPEPPKEGA
jgi:hypothetical protein